MTRALSAIAIVVALLFSIATADAKSFACGAVQRAYFCKHQGVCLSKDYNYSLAWADLPSAYPAPGVVVIQRRKGKASDGKLPGGHVSRIVRLKDGDSCHATVTDEAGTYERDICSNLVGYVRP
jgi:hypothetical protein